MTEVKDNAQSNESERDTKREADSAPKNHAKGDRKAYEWPRSKYKSATAKVSLPDKLEPSDDTDLIWRAKPRWLRKKKKKSIFCWCRQIVLSCILLLMIALIASWMWFTRSDFITQQASQLLAKTLNMPVQVEQGSFSIDGTVRLQKVKLLFPDQMFQTDPGAPDAFATTELIEINLNYRALLKQEVVLDSILVDKLNLTIIEQQTSEASQAYGNYWLPKLTPQKKTDDKPKPPPQITIRNSTITTGVWHDDDFRYTHRGQIPFQLTANPTVDDIQKLSLNLSMSLPQVTENETKTLSLNGSYSGGSKTGYLAFSNVGLNDEILKLMPEEIQSIIKSHDIRTSLTDGRIARTEEGQWQINAAIQEISIKQAGKLLKALELNLSDELDWAANRDFEGISGEINLTQKKKQVILQGRINDPDFGTNFRASALITRETENFDSIDVAIQLTDGHILRKPPGIPPQIGKIFDDYKLFGNFDGLLKFTRNLGEKEKPENDIYGFINLSEGTVTAKQFPYTLKNLTGRVDIAGGVVYIKDFIGFGDSGNRIEGNGHLTLTEPRTAKMVIEARQIKLDQQLFDVLGNINPGVIDRIDGLLGQKTMDAYNQRLQAFAPLLADKTIKPLTQDDFKLQSTPDLTINVGYTPPPKLFDEAGNKIKGKWGIGFTIDLTGSTCIYEKFLYPLTVTSGKVHVENNIITAKDLAFKGYAGGTGVLNGTFKPLNLSVETSDTPLNHHLLCALPEKIARQLAPLNLQGQGDAQGKIVAGSKPGDEQYEFAVLINNSSAAPGSGSYRLENIQADLSVTKGGSVIHHLSAEHVSKDKKKTDWQLAAQFMPSKTLMKVRAQALDLTHPAYELIPDELDIKRQIAGYLDQFKVAGAGDLDVDVTIDQASKKTDTLVELKPSELAFDYKGFRQNWTDVSGTLRFKQPKVSLRNLAFTSQSGRAEVGGSVSFENKTPKYNLNFKTVNSKLGPDINVLIPQAVQKLIKDIEFKGAFKTLVGSLAFDEANPKQNKLNLVSDIDNLSMNVGVPVKRMKTKLTIDASQFGGKSAETPLLNMTMQAPSSEVSGLSVRDLRLNLVNSKENRDTYHAKSIKGKLAGQGSLAANVTIVQGNAPSYQAEIILDNVPLNDIANNASASEGEVAPAKSATQASVPGAKQTENPKTNKASTPQSSVMKSPTAGNIEGVFSTNIAIEAKGQKKGESTPPPITGRGGFTFRDARINELPLLAAVGMSMATILNLDLAQLTQQQSVSGESQFIINGKDITINPFMMKLPSMEVKGGGRMDWESQQIDLNLQAHPPQTDKLPSALKNIAKTVTDRLISLEIKGPVGNPQTTFVTLGGVRQTWDSIFKNGG